MISQEEAISARRSGHSPSKLYERLSICKQKGVTGIYNRGYLDSAQRLRITYAQRFLLPPFPPSPPLLLLLLAGCSASEAATLPATAAPSATPTAPPPAPLQLPSQPPPAPPQRKPPPSRPPLPPHNLPHVDTPTVTPTATSGPQGVVLMQAFCRYGPGKAYLYSHGLYENDHVTLRRAQPLRALAVGEAG